MSTRNDYAWTPINGTGYPDQEADISGPYWASVGPDAGTSWSWTVLESVHDGADNAEIASGVEPSEAEAKAAAVAYVQQIDSTGGRRDS